MKKELDLVVRRTINKKVEGFKVNNNEFQTLVNEIIKFCRTHNDKFLFDNIVLKGYLKDTNGHIQLIDDCFSEFFEIDMNQEKTEIKVYTETFTESIQTPTKKGE